MSSSLKSCPSVKSRRAPFVSFRRHPILAIGKWQVGWLREAFETGWDGMGWDGTSSYGDSDW
ncbi:hypothetical protein BofuT4_uP083700.1 [Botrytis cinerea T4]|uniref:Uncharacterized protein n=1 Tax=Botryotinia fuckeliana (strain T4) TaxID=999810 RepID=G2YK19_BOTF4|nr:hypothetical protein BofuT4_uP083700.1 [Botrytis cinerea T4]